MFDMTKLVTRYFEVTLPNGDVISIEPPTLKGLKKILTLAKIEKENINVEEAEEVFSSLAEGISLAISKNKQNKRYSVEWVTDNMDFDTMTVFLTAYYTWVAETRNEKN